ncbi:MAG: ATP-binding cassette domain-containing protein, partial [Chloroflexi bacterium]|nr:ATP-binding cassette domain-containing protein [Chloroflexota bacterium]
MAIHEALPLLRIRDATVRKGTNGSRTLLDRLSLEIPRGQHTAILGPNGSGKSSLIKLITQELRPLVRPGQDPPVQIFGRDRWDVFELRSLMGIVSSDLHHTFTGGASARPLHGLDVVVSAFFASRGVQSHHEVTGEMWRRGRDALELMEASHLAHIPMHEMSTGEARRVLIARALVSDPPALLLDEPTAGLDVVARQRFLETIRRLARSGRTIIFVTHHLYEVIPEVGRIVLLREGRVYLEGSKHEVLTAPHL